MKAVIHAQETSREYARDGQHKVYRIPVESLTRARAIVTKSVSFRDVPRAIIVAGDKVELYQDGKLFAVDGAKV